MLSGSQLAVGIHHPIVKIKTSYLEASTSTE